MKRSTIVKLALAAAATPLGARPALARGEVNPALDAVVKLAQKEGQLNVLQQNFGDPEMWSKIQDAINARYHLEVRLVGRPGPAGAALTPRLVEEVGAGRTPSSDIIFNPPIQQIALDRAQVPLRVNWHELDPSIPAAVIGGGGASLIVGSTVYIAAYNTRLIAPNAVPKRLDDLRNPRYKGLLATTPYGGAWYEVAVAVGLAEVTSLLKEIVANGNLRGFLQMTDAQSVAAGQVGMLVFSDNYIVQQTIAAKAPVATASLGMCIGTTLALNIVKGTQCPNVAKLVGLFLASREGQAILYDYLGHDSPFIPGSNSYRTFQAARRRGEKVVLETDQLVAGNAPTYEQMAKNYAQLVGAG